MSHGVGELGVEVGGVVELVEEWNELSGALK